MAKREAKTVVDTKDIPLTDKIIKFIQQNKTGIVGFFAVALVAGISFVGYSQFQKSKELRIETELYGFRAQIDKLSESEIPPAGEEIKAPPKKPEFEEIKSIASQWESAIAKNSSSASAATAAIDLAGTYMEYKKFDQAKSLLQKIKPSSDVLASLVNNQLATVLFELGDYQGSIDNLEKVIKSKKQSYLHPDALLKKGLSYYKMGNTEKALAAFEQVAEEFAGKSSADTAEKYIRVLKFKSKSSASTN